MAEWGGSRVISAFVLLTNGDSSQALILLAFHVDHLKWLKHHPAPGDRSRTTQAGIAGRHDSSIRHWDKLHGWFHFCQVW